MPGPGQKQVFERFDEFADSVAARLCKQMKEQEVPFFVLFADPKTGELTTGSTIPEEGLVQALNAFLKQMDEVPKRIIDDAGKIIGDPNDN